MRGNQGRSSGQEHGVRDWSIGHVGRSAAHRVASSRLLSHLSYTAQGLPAQGWHHLQKPAVHQLASHTWPWANAIWFFSWSSLFPGDSRYMSTWYRVPWHTRQLSCMRIHCITAMMLTFKSSLLIVILYGWAIRSCDDIYICSAYISEVKFLISIVSKWFKIGLSKLSR